MNYLGEYCPKWLYSKCGIDKWINRQVCDFWHFYNNNKKIYYILTIAEAAGPLIITTTTADITASSGLPIDRQTSTPIPQHHMQQ